jgi:hypothetical protein
MLACASERYEGGLTAYVPRDFQLRIARVPSANHLAVSFEDPELEKARQARRIIEQNTVLKLGPIVAIDWSRPVPLDQQ